MLLFKEVKKATKTIPSKKDIARKEKHWYKIPLRLKFTLKRLDSLIFPIPDIKRKTIAKLIKRVKTRQSLIITSFLLVERKAVIKIKIITGKKLFASGSITISEKVI